MSTHSDTDLLPVTAEKQSLAIAGIHDSLSFEHLQRVAKLFSRSELVPAQFRGDAGIPNTVIALEMSKRLNASPLAVMQSMYVVHGKPAWASTFIIACINSSGRFTPLRFTLSGTGEAMVCFAWAHDSETAEKVEGPPVSIDMAKKEGWYGKNGSKWPTMPELMLRYRAATLFGRLYAPELLMGMRSVEEVIDIEAQVVPAKPTFGKANRQPKEATPKE